MSCPEWEALLVERSRGNPGGDARLEPHLAVCPPCAARLAEERRLTSVLAAAARPDASLRPPVRIEAAVRAAARAAARSRPAPERRVGTGRLLWAAAAALLVAVLPLLRSAPTPSSPPRETRFVSLPGAEPLAPGEPGQLVRVGLSPAALQALGWSVEMESGGLLETELILGSDGVARAILLGAGMGARRPAAPGGGKR
jgi:hypothetical protein